MELRSAAVRKKISGDERYPATYVRLIYEIEESSRLWIVDLPWTCRDSAVIKARTEKVTREKFLRVYGHSLASERIVKMWSDFNRLRQEEDHD